MDCKIVTGYKQHKFHHALKASPLFHKMSPFCTLNTVAHLEKVMWTITCIGSMAMALSKEALNPLSGE